MNPALEYFLRSGIAKDKFQTPCSLYLDHLIHYEKKLIVTIQWHPFSRRYMVKHWKIEPFSSEDILPKFDEFNISTKQDLFTSNKTILLMYDLIPFLVEPYKSGITQRATGHTSREQVKEYKDTLDKFYYPDSHKMRRITWLWMAFTENNKDIPSDIFDFPFIQEQMTVVMNEIHKAWLAWNAWCKFFICPTEIAPELYFHTEYEQKSKKWYA